MFQHPYILAIAGSLLIILLLWLTRLLFRKDGYAPKRLLTKNEEEFFGRLVEALPEFFIFPQVAFRAFIRPLAKSTDTTAYQRQLGRIGSKHCDFLICNAKLDVVAIIELDDASHVLERDIARDALTGKAGYTTIRYESKFRPSVDEIRDDILRLKI